MLGRVSAAKTVLCLSKPNAVSRLFSRPIISLLKIVIIIFVSILLQVEILDSTEIQSNISSVLLLFFITSRMRVLSKKALSQKDEIVISHFFVLDLITKYGIQK